MAEPFAAHPQAQRSPRMGVLYEEHLVLGASFGERTVPLIYAHETEAEAQTQSQGAYAYVADLSHAQVLLFAGAPAPNFARSAFAGPELAVGECAYQAVLTGDGSVADVALLARTGNAEYVSFSDSARREVLLAWLSFLAGISQDGAAPFAGMDTQDVSGGHSLFLVWGPQATSILADYTSKAKLPRPGEVKSCMLDSIPCIVCGLPAPASAPARKASHDDWYLLFVPPQRARVLWRSLLSFGALSPCGVRNAERMLAARYPWRSRLAEADVLRLGRDELVSQGLVRPEPDFVGARGLYAR